MNNPVIYQRDTATGDFNNPDNFEPVEAQPIVSQDRLSIDDDMGTETYIKTIRSDTLLGIRRAVRELHRGHVQIFSDYDCTGLVCWQGCKMLKIYRCYTGFYVAVVELTVTRDV